MTDSVADHQLGGNSNPDDMNPCLVETGGRVMEELMDGLDADEKDNYAIGVS